MIIIKNKKIKEVYYSEDIPRFSFLDRVVYIQSLFKNSRFGFIRKNKYTKLIYLDNSDQLLKNFKTTTRNEIRKAERLGVEFKVENNIFLFVDFYNDFADSIGLKKLTHYDVNRFRSSLIITKSLLNERILTMHSYFFDKNISRVRLLHSASLHNSIEDRKERALIGYANRFLHFKDMEYFINEGFKIYDLGGYAYNSTDKHMQNINKFKDSFGGELEKNYNYIPIWVFLAGKVKNLFK